MKIYPTVWRKDGFGLRRIALPNVTSRETILTRYHRRSPSLRCAYWQIWHDGPKGKRVIDRALTLTVAKKRIEYIKANPQVLHD